MFGKNNAGVHSPVREPSSQTVIHEGTVLQGSLEVAGPARIDGRLKGSLRVRGALFVGPQAEIEADVEAVEARVAGSIRGNLKCRESVELLPGSRLQGDVYTQCFRIEDGAFFQGNCHMGEAYVEDLQLG